MNLQDIFTQIVAAQEASTLPPADFYRALVRLSKMDWMLQTALVRSSWTVGTPHPLPAPDNPIPAMSDAVAEAVTDLGEASRNGKVPESGLKPRNTANGAH